MDGYLSILLWLLLSLPTAQYLLSLISTVLIKKSPPGPIPLPIIGNFLTLRNKQASYYESLARTHGPMTLFRLGPTTQIFVASTASIVKEIFQRDDLVFSQRQQVDAARDHNESSIFFTPPSTLWRTMRRLSYTHLLSGTSLNGRRDMRAKKLQELVSYVRGCCETNTAVDIGQTGFSTALNVMSNSIFSIDVVDLSSNSCHEIKHVMSELIRVIAVFNLADYIPVLKVLDPQGLRARFSASLEKIQGLVDGMIDEKLAKQADGSGKESNCSDMLDGLLMFSQQNKDFDRSLIAHMIVDFFIAGTDTNSVTVEWAMTELLRHPKILKTAQQELERVVGNGNFVEETHIHRLRYLNAVIKETWRLHPLVPFFQRQVTSDVELGGFKVPKDSLLWINALGIARDPGVWTNPNSFDPERFLGHVEIDVKGKNFELLPFGSGPRMCPGLTLATRVVPLMLGCLIHFFDWRVDDPESLDIKDTWGTILRKVKPLRVVPIVRS